MSTTSRPPFSMLPRSPRCLLPAGSPRRPRQRGCRRLRACPVHRAAARRQGAEGCRRRERDLRSLIEKLKDRVEAVQSRRTRSGQSRRPAARPRRAGGEDVRTRAVREAEEMITKAEESPRSCAPTPPDAEATKAKAMAEIDERARRCSGGRGHERRDQGPHRRPRAHAEREAAQMRLAAEQESQNMRLGATREVEQARAAADREVTEARRVLAVEKERWPARPPRSTRTRQSRPLSGRRRRARAAGPTTAPATSWPAAKARDAASDEATRMLESAKKEAAALKAERERLTPITSGPAPPPTPSVRPARCVPRSRTSSASATASCRRWVSCATSSPRSRPRQPRPSTRWNPPSAPRPSRPSRRSLSPSRSRPRRLSHRPAQVSADAAHLRELSQRRRCQQAVCQWRRSSIASALSRAFCTGQTSR